MHNFRDLQVWQIAMQVAEDVYLLLADLPREERFELASQLRRSAVSVPSNIAEGAGRGTDKEFAHFLNIAMSSANELETQLLLAKKLLKETNLKVDGLLPKLHQVQKMLYSLIKRYRV